MMRQIFIVAFFIFICNYYCVAQVNFSPNWGKRAHNPSEDNENGCKESVETLIFIYKMIQFDDLSHKSSASSLSTSTAKISNASPSTRKKHADEEEEDSITITVTTMQKNQTLPPTKPPRSELKSPQQDEWELKLFGNSKLKANSNLRAGVGETLNRRSWDSSKLSPQIIEENLDHTKNADTISIKSTPEVTKKEDGMFAKLKNNFRKDKDKEFSNDLVSIRPGTFGNLLNERVIIGGEKETLPEKPHKNHLSNEVLKKFEGKSREDLILSLVETQNDLEKHKKKLKDLEDYLDDLLLRVMETTPRILQNPYVTYKMSQKQFSER